MAKETFKLETYLKLKEREKKDAELGLGRAIESLKAEEQQLAHLNNELLRMEQERIAKRQEYAEKQMAGSMNAQSMMPLRPGSRSSKSARTSKNAVSKTSKRKSRGMRRSSKSPVKHWPRALQRSKPSRNQKKSGKRSVNERCSPRPKLRWTR